VPLGDDNGVEVLLTIVGLVIDVISFQLRWRAGAYFGTILAAVAVGMVLAGHLRRR
jgi:uncharacterized membrane protein YczE